MASLKSAKKKAWSAFARYIKARDSVDGYCTCITCGEKKAWNDKYLHAGHFVSSRCNAVLFDDAHVFPQCYSCNIGRCGEQFKFGLFLKTKYRYDDETLSEIQNMKHQTKKYTLTDYKDIEDRFTKLANKIIKEKGL